MVFASAFSAVTGTGSAAVCDGSVLAVVIAQPPSHTISRVIDKIRVNFSKVTDIGLFIPVF
jgi:hypothetical protein